jgi:hypothetical protein
MIKPTLSSLESAMLNRPKVEVVRVGQLPAGPMGSRTTRRKRTRGDRRRAVLRFELEA